MKSAWRYVLSAALLLGCVSTAQPAQIRNVTEQKGRVGNWYYISGIDRMFHVPRFVGAVHDTEARTSLIFTCQGRPGAPRNKDASPLMTLMLSDPIGAPGDKMSIRMRLDETAFFNTKWETTAARETRLDGNDQTDPQQLLFRIVGNKHRVLVLELKKRRLNFEMDGANVVLFRMLDTCVKPAMGMEAKARKRGRK